MMAIPALVPPTGAGLFATWWMASSTGVFFQKFTYSDWSPPAMNSASALRGARRGSTVVEVGGSALGRRLPAESLVRPPIVVVVEPVADGRVELGCGVPVAGPDQLGLEG